jgi:hypothetical protein
MTVKVYDKKNEKKMKDGQGTMLDLAKKVERHYTSPSPQATIHEPAYFPVLLDVYLVGGLVAGAALGALFGWLVHNGAIVVRGWEGLFSLTPVTFYTFWGLVGAALGLLIGGVIALVQSPAPILQERSGEEAVVVEEDMHVVMVDVEE